MNKINIRLKFITTVCFTYFLFISGINAQTNFLPSDISGLKLWLTGDSVSTSTPPYITKCFDLSSEKNHANQTDPIARPVSVTSILNGHKSMRFDGVNHLLNYTNISDIRTVFWLIKEDSNATVSNRPLLGSTTNYDFFRGDNQELWHSTYTNNFIVSGITRLNSNVIDGRTKILPPQYSILSLVTTGNVSTDIFSKDRSNNGRIWNGDLVELIIYNQPLSGIQVQQVENYLHFKYAPPVQLGSDQIVCSFPLTLKAKKSYFKNYKWQDNTVADSIVVNAPGTYYVTTTDIFNTLSSDTITITKDTVAYAVKLGKDTAVCSGQSVKLYAGPPHLSYLWSTGSTKNNISVNASGSYNVSVTDCFGNVSKDTIYVDVHPIPTFKLGADTLICFNSSHTIDPGFANSLPYTFKWFDGTIDSIHTVTHGGSYYVKVSDNIGCAFSDTIKITVDSLLSNVSLGVDTTFCAGNVIGLHKGSGNVVSYAWSTGSSNSTIPITITGKYWLTVKSVNNCPASDTINVIVSGIAPVSDFSFVNTCLKNTTRFTDLSSAPAGETLVSWNWNFGDSFLSSAQNPMHVYADTGTYNVQLLVTTLAGCSELRKQTVHIYPRPKLNFLVSNLCEDVTASFTGQSVTYGYPVILWSWNFADPTSGPKNNSALQNPTHIFENGGLYPVTLTADNTKGCIDTLVKNVIINTAPITDFSFSLACKDANVSFKDLTVLPSGAINVANYWNFGNGTSALLNPIHSFSANVKYNVMHVVTASNGCKDTIIKSVDVHATPTALFTNSNSCEMNATTFTDLSLISSGNITGWEWTFDNKGTSTNKNPQYSFVKPGNAIVKHVVISNFGCKDSVTKTIVVYPKPVAHFTNSPEYGNPGQVVNFTNTSTGANTYLWNFDDAGATSTAVNPAHIYTAVGSYHPSLVATSAIGCTDTVLGGVLILKRFMDVAITGITTQVQNGGGVLLNDYLSVHVNLVNKSTADVFVLDLYLETSDGAAIKESWTGKLLKGNSMTYDFKASPNVKASDHFICVAALNPNGLNDEIPIDNKVCKALDVTVFKVLAPFPNPADDVLIIPLIIPENGELNMIIYDANGKEMEKMFSGSIAQGLQLMTLDTRVFNAGVYVCKVQLAGETLFTKFIKK